jgi:CheY-like chemotaxis protein
MNGCVPIVLLIEHDAIQRGTLARLLKAAGYSVIPAGRPHEALETFATHHVDIALVIADTHIGPLAGPPLLQSLATIDPVVPVVVLSAGVALDRPAYEYPNVAATLIRPFEPADVLAHVERVLLAVANHDTARAVALVPPITPRTIARGVPFNWPPTEEDLADIQVVDTSSWQAPRPVYQLSLDARPSPPIADAEALVKPAPTVVPTANVVRVPQTPPPRLVVNGLERRPWAYMQVGHALRPSARARRTMAVAATALFGLTLTTLFELRGVPARQAEAVDEMTTSESATRPALPSNDHDVKATRPIPAERVRSRAVSDAIVRRHEPTLDELAANASARLSLAFTPLTRMLPPAPKAAASIDQPRDTARRDASTSNRAPAPAALARSLAPIAPAATPSMSPTPSAPSTRSSSVDVAAPRAVAAREAAVRDTAARDTAAGAAATRDAVTRDAAPRDGATRDTAAGDAVTREAVTAANRLAANGPAPALSGPALSVSALSGPALPAAAPAVVRPREDERGIYQVLQQYQRAYERLDVNAARAVWPSLDARALSRAFDGLKAQALEFSHCRLAMQTAEATAICGGSASYVPRVGRQSARTERREWTFRLRKVDHDWQIAKAEVR